MSGTGRAGRRTSTRRGVNPTAVLAVLLPLLTVGALLLVQTHDEPLPDRPPTSRPLTQTALGCPAVPRGTDDPTLGLATALDGVSGEVGVRAGGAEEAAPVQVRSGEVTEADAGADAAVVRTSGDLAPGLLAARWGTSPTSAVSCGRPAPETWFSGVGAGSTHDSTLELVNPDAGPAVADVFVYAPSGQVDAPRLRGITVRGREALQIPLSEAFPRRAELSLRVVVSRGRLAASVLDSVPPLGSRPLSTDWLPPQDAPAEEVLLLGLPTGEGEDLLTIANPGDDEVRATIRIVTADAAFAPEGLEEVRIPPLGSRQVTVSSAVRAAMREGALGLRVSGTAPVLAGLRSVVDDDLSAAAAVLPLEAAATLPVPAGEGSVVLADAAGAGVATVTSWSADGRLLEEERVELAEGAGGRVDLPKDAALVRVTPKRTTVHAVLLVTGDGTAVLGFHEPVTDALVPDVQPGLP